LPLQVLPRYAFSVLVLLDLNRLLERQVGRAGGTDFSLCADLPIARVPFFERERVAAPHPFASPTFLASLAFAFLKG
jgi:hypothetical protein